MHYFSLHRLWSALLTLGRAGALQTLGSVPWLGIFMAGSSVFAQTAGKQPSERDAVNSRPTKDVTVVESASVPFGTVVAFGDEVRAKLKDAMYPRIERFPLSRDKAVDLELERFWVTSPGAQFVVGTDQGDRPLSPPDVALFKGEVAGQPDSRVFLSVRPDGSNGFVYLNGEEFVISNLKGKRAGLPANSHLVFSRADTKPFAPQAAFDCEALTPPGQVEEVATELATVATVVTRQANVAFDCDYEFRQMFANLAEATAYVIELAGAVSTIYEDDIAMRLNASFIRVWDTAADPYVATNTSGALEELRTHWNSTMTSVPRNTVHMLSGKNSGGGIAYVNQMCGGQYA